MLKKGDVLKVKTHTVGDTFGEVVYVVLEVGLQCTLKPCTEKDGIKVMMLGGTGPSARKGPLLRDCLKNIRLNIQQGITTIYTGPQARAMAAFYDNIPENGRPQARPTQGIEM